MDINCRLGPADYDIAAAAGWYSAIAGLLAGFALLSVLFPLDHQATDVDEESEGHSVVVFACAFFALVTLAFSYAVLSGRTGEESAGLAAHEQLLNGAAFGLSFLLLLFALQAVLAMYGANREVLRPAQALVRTVTSTLAPAAVIALQFSNAIELERYRIAQSDNPDCGAWGLAPGVWINLGITVTALLAVLVLALLRDRIPRRRSVPTLTAKVILGFTVAVVGWSAIVLPLVPVELVTGAVLEHVVLALTAGATVVVAAASWSSR